MKIFNGTNKKAVIGTLILVVLLLVSYLVYTKHKDLGVSVQTVPVQSNLGLESTSYPVGSYKVFVEQIGGAGSKVQPKISVYNAINGDSLRPVEDYVYYSFYSNKNPNDALAINCANIKAYYPVDEKSTSNSTLWKNPYNTNHDPNTDSAISIYLEKEINNLSFVCVPR